jgi:hypothetical protein
MGTRKQETNLLLIGVVLVCFPLHVGTLVFVVVSSSVFYLGENFLDLLHSMLVSFTMEQLQIRNRHLRAKLAPYN